MAVWGIIFFFSSGRAEEIRALIGLGETELNKIGANWQGGVKLRLKFFTDIFGTIEEFASHLRHDGIHLTAGGSAKLVEMVSNENQDWLNAILSDTNPETLTPLSELNRVVDLAYGSDERKTELGKSLIYYCHLDARPAAETGPRKLLYSITGIFNRRVDFHCCIVHKLSKIYTSLMRKIYVSKENSLQLYL